MKKVVIIENVLAHYRRDLYQYFLDCDDFQFEIVAGKEYQGVEGLEENDSFRTLSYFSFMFLKHRFYYLKGSIRYVLSKKPFLIMCKGADFHHIHTIILFFLYRIVLRRRFYWWSHGTTGNQGRIGVIVRGLIYRAASGNLVYSRRGMETLLSMGVGIENIKIIGNAFNWDDYGYLNRNIYSGKVHDDNFRILFSGRIFKERKLDILIRAVSLIISKYGVRVSCCIVGGGEVEVLRKLSFDLDVETAVQFPGAKFGKDVHDYFNASDLLVYPGPIGLALLHAYSFGIPVITTNNMQAQMPEIELLSPGLTGDLYKDNSVEDLVTKILIWKEKISESREAIRQKCIDRIEELGYLPDRVGDSVISYFRKRYQE